eukprot:349687-Chlamydomonas_euryale.AAC.11
MKGRRGRPGEGGRVCSRRGMPRRTTLPDTTGVATGVATGVPLPSPPRDAGLGTRDVSDLISQPPLTNTSCPPLPLPPLSSLPARSSLPLLHAQLPAPLPSSLPPFPPPSSPCKLPQPIGP